MPVRWESASNAAPPHRPRRCILPASVALAATLLLLSPTTMPAIAQDDAAQPARGQAQQRANRPQVQMRVQIQIQDEVIILEDGDVDIELIVNDMARRIERINPQAAQEQGVWINRGQGGLTTSPASRFTLIDMLPEEQRTPETIVALMSWFGMAMLDDEPLSIEGWSERQLLEALGAPDSNLRLRVTRALAASNRHDEHDLLSMARRDGLSLEQRTRLLDVLFARFLASPRAAVGASFQNTLRAPVRISQIFPDFPAFQSGTLQIGDELMEIAGRPMTGHDPFQILRAEVLSRQPGETVPMIIRRPFPPEQVGRILVQRDRELEALREQARANAIARAEQPADPAADADAVEDDPVMQAIIRQIAVLEAKNPEATIEITPEGDVLFANQRLGNIAHLDGQHIRHRARVIVPEPTIQHDPFTPGVTLSVDVPLGSLGQLRNQGNGSMPGAADLHMAWQHRLATLGLDPRSTGARRIEVQTPERGWRAAAVGQRVTTMVSAPRSQRQGIEASTGLLPLPGQQHVAVRGVNQPVWSAQAQRINAQPAGTINDPTTFRLHNGEHAGAELQPRRHIAMNEAAATLAELNERSRAIDARLLAAPAGPAAEALERERARLEQRIAALQRELAPTIRR